jgi:hypothetical protein
VKYKGNGLVWFGSNEALVKQKRFEPPIPKKKAPLWDGTL